MSSTDPWPCIIDERTALARDLAELTDEQWHTPSLCAGWTIEDVVAHLTQRNVLSRASMLGVVVRARGLQAMVDAGIAKFRGVTSAQTLAAFIHTSHLRHSGLFSRDLYLGELVIHAEDVRRPLGITHLYPRDEINDLLVTRMRLARKLLAGIRLSAGEGGPTAGTGLPIEGPAMSLLMVASGRAAHLDDLTGPGVPVLAARLAAR